MTKYTYTVGGRSEVGALGWNANSTLKTLGITDPFNAGNAQNCTYIHDDLTRLQNVACGSVWAQSFNYDAFGNTTKSGSSSWMPLYNSKNQYSSIPGFSNPGPTYDANGDLLTDSFHTYTWDADGHVTAIDSIGLTYDALGRQVEQNQSGTYFQIVYSPMGTKLAVMKGQTIQQAFVPLARRNDGGVFVLGIEPLPSSGLARQRTSGIQLQHHNSSDSPRYRVRAIWRALRRTERRQRRNILHRPE